jgi:F-type H+-transporting ATPase subunit gamma
MPSIKAIGIRLKSVSGTAKITKAMKMVAASKLKGAEKRMESARPFSASVSVLLEPTLTPGEDDEAAESALLMGISSDKGLCGGINSKVTKEMKLALDSAGEEKPTLMIIGNKSVGGLVRTHGQYINTTIDEVYTMPTTFSSASFITEQMLATPAGQYGIVFNNFKSVINQEVITKVIKGPEVLGGSGVLDEFEFEGDKEIVLADLYQFNLACTVYSCLLENITSEQASRMTAMDSATTNANEAANKLRVQYNRLRQAKITTELTEIVAGAESV